MDDGILEGIGLIKLIGKINIKQSELDDLIIVNENKLLEKSGMCFKELNEYLNNLGKLGILQRGGSFIYLTSLGKYICAAIQ